MPKAQDHNRPPRIDVGEHKRFPTTNTGDAAALRTFAIEAARLLHDDKCEDVVLLDVQGLSQVCDYVIVGSGTSDRQMRSAADDVRKLAAKTGHGVFGRDADDRATWIVVDLVDVVVHVFEPNTRAHYDLEMLWADAPRVEWHRPGEKPRNRAGID